RTLGRHRRHGGRGGVPRQPRLRLRDRHGHSRRRRLRRPGMRARQNRLAVSGPLARMLGVNFRRTAIIVVLMLTLAACASAPPRAARSEFEDIPVPKGLTFQADRSKVYESPAVKAAWLVYRGRVEIESLAVA